MHEAGLFPAKKFHLEGGLTKNFPAWQPTLPPYLQSWSAGLGTPWEDIQAHLQTIYLFWKDANDEGANITDSIYQMILVSSLPITFYTVIGNMMAAPNTIEAEVIIPNWKATLDRTGGGLNIPTVPSNLTMTALEAKSKPNWSQLTCNNCHCRGHTSNDCYWEGRGKERQLSTYFGKKGGGGRKDRVI